jgi:hypothetical protein
MLLYLVILIRFINNFLEVLVMSSFLGNLRSIYDGITEYLVPLELVKLNQKNIDEIPFDKEDD